ncbi:MAG: YggS family pyridoxal phosphate-dependent enzyme [Candidatus Thiosymbion ectosymbiont of Robbea hypermnestra]|nr:YggS family pyridoxal phosphate-dependent enzyme [Candidatus Thiosymbion ectosymbiont of Robbea hypermnestra]
MRLDAVRERIRAAEERSGRAPGSVALLAVSKKQDAAKLRAAFAAGQTAFGESYAQEATGKMETLGPLDIQWHFIGRIQSNKTRQIAERFDWVHGLCDLKHAHRLSAQRPAGSPPLAACVQVNLDAEPGKAGLAPDRVADFVAACAGLPHLELVGLMTLPAPTEDKAAQGRPFRALRLLRDRIATPARPLPVLSMGMSADLEAAIAEGATLVRVGTAIFGPRA